MIVQFNTTSLEIRQVVAGSSSSLLAFFVANIPGTDDAQIIADDSDVLDNVAILDRFVAVVSGPTLTSVARKRIITLTASSNPINLNDVPTVTVQLKESDGTTNYSAAVAVDFTASLGAITNNTLTTDGSGSIVTSFRPNKGGGSIITCSAPAFVSGSLTMTINTPSTFAEQNWIAENDVKDGSISNEKIEPLFKAKRLSVPSWWHVTKPSVRATFNLSFDDRINSIVGDDQGLIFVNGRLSGNATLLRVNKYTGAVTHTYDYSAVGNNLADQLDTMTCDGQNIWLPAGTKLLKVQASDATLLTTVSLNTKVESAVWNGDDVWCWDNRNSSAGGLFRVNNAGTSSHVTGTAFGVNAQQFVTITVDQNNVYLLSDSAGAAFAVKTATTSGQFNGLFGAPPANSGVIVSIGAGTYNWPIAADGKSIWVGGDGGILRMDVVNPGTAALSLYSAASDFNTVGQVYSIVYAGDTNAVWAVTSANGYSGSPVVGQYLRKLVQSGTTIVVDQEIDLLAAPASMANPVPIYFDGDHIYVGDFGVSTSDVVKVFVGK